MKKMRKTLVEKGKKIITGELFGVVWLNVVCSNNLDDSWQNLARLVPLYFFTFANFGVQLGSEDRQLLIHIG